MSGSAFEIVFPVLALLAYALLVSFCKVLNARIQQELQIHDRVRESRRMRLEYIEELARRRYSSMEFEE